MSSLHLSSYFIKLGVDTPLSFFLFLSLRNIFPEVSSNIQDQYQLAKTTILMLAHTNVDTHE